MIDLPDPDQSAERLLTSSGVYGLPIDVNSVAAKIPGLMVVEDDLDGDGIFYDLGIHGAQIMLKRDAHPLRKKFTLAHEIGHFIVREQAAAYVVNRRSYRNSEIERWCNKFAASLLMPKELMLGYLRTAKLSGIVDAVSLGPRSFSVSEAAFRGRVVELTPSSIFGFYITQKINRRDSFYLSKDKNTYWREEYNKLLYRGLADKEFSGIVDRGTAVLVFGWPSIAKKFDEGAELIFISISSVPEGTTKPAAASASSTRESGFPFGRGRRPR